MDCRHKQKMSISSHASEALDHRHVLLQGLPHRTLATVILVGHGIDWIYKKGRKLLQGLEGREMQRNMSGCQYICVRGRSPRPVFEATKQRGGRHGTRKRQLQLIERRNATQQMLKTIRRNTTEDRRSKGSLDKSLVFRPKWN